MNLRTLALATALPLFAGAAPPLHAVGPEVSPPAPHPANPVTPDDVIPPDMGEPNAKPKSATDTPAAARAGAKESSLSEPYRTFVILAWQFGLREIAAANVALVKAKSDKVKGYAKMMATDHMKNGAELRGIAERGYVKAGQVDDKNGAKIETLKKSSGADFDRAYMADMVQGHRAAVALFEDAQKDVADADLKAYIERTLPTLRQHLSAAQQISKDVEGGAAN
jgi:putative membrane protein